MHRTDSSDSPVLIRAFCCCAGVHAELDTDAGARACARGKFRAESSVYATPFSNPSNSSPACLVQVGRNPVFAPKNLFASCSDDEWTKQLRGFLLFF